MSVQTNTAAIHLPAGCTVLVGDSAEHLQDIGVIPMETDSQIKVNYDLLKVQGSKREEVVTGVRNMRAEGNTDIYQIRLNTINELLGNIMNLTSHPASPVSGETFVIPANSEAGRLFILPGQNASREKQTITTVKKGGTTINADGYNQIKDSSGAWGIALKAAPDGDVTVTYGYTPAEYVRATMGDGIVSIKKKVVRFQKEQDGKLFQVTLFSAVSTDGLTLSFPGADADKPVSIPFKFEGGLDTRRAKGEQLLEIIDEIGVN